MENWIVGCRRGVRAPWAAVPAALIAVMLLLGAGEGAAQETVRPTPGAAGTTEEAAWQAASWIATVPYGAAKMGVALLGGLVGGIGYVLSGGDLESSQTIWDSSLSGTYVLSPEHLKGDRPVVFFVVPETQDAGAHP